MSEYFGLERDKEIDVPDKGRIFYHDVEADDLNDIGKYDAIVLCEIIEHFQDPRLEMKSLQKLLKPGGLLVVWTGDVDSISSKLLGKNWWYWQGQHIQYFSEKSLNHLAFNYGVRHIQSKIYPFVAFYGLVENSLSRYKIRPLIMALLTPLFLLKPRWTFYIPGEMLWFGVKKT